MPTGIPKAGRGKWNGHIKLSDIERKKRSAANARKWQAANRERARSNKLMRTYGVTHQEYMDLKGADGCFICDRECPSGRYLAIDHDHSNGVIRGLLCINCNKGLGNFKEDISLLEKAIQYLRDYRQLLLEGDYVSSDAIQYETQA